MVEFATAKTTPEALRMLRLIAAATGEKQYEVLQRLFQAELRRLRIMDPAEEQRPAPRGKRLERA